jgi:hypothetical protein
MIMPAGYGASAAWAKSPDSFDLMRLSRTFTKEFLVKHNLEAL